MKSKCVCGKAWTELRLKGLRSPSRSTAVRDRLVLWHLLDCSKNASWHSRHLSALDEITVSLGSAFIHVQREPMIDPSSSSGLRGDLSIRLRSRTDNIMDLSIVNPLSGSRYIPARCTPLDHLGFAETIKRTKYRSLNNIPNKAFTPFIMSVFGAFGQAAVQWLTDVGLYIHENCPWIDATSWKRKLVRNLALVVQEENWSMLARGCKRISVRKLNNTEAQVAAISH